MTKLLAGGLGLSVLVNAFLALTARNTALAAQKVVLAARENADQRVAIAEARYDRLLDRIDTGKRVELAPPTPETARALSEKKPYVSDFEYDDEYWDEQREATD